MTGATRGTPVERRELPGCPPGRRTWPLRARLRRLGIALCLAAACGQPQPGGPATIHTTGTTGAVAVGEGSVWVADASEGKLLRADETTGRVLATLTIGDHESLVRDGCGAANVHSFTTGEFTGRRCDLPSGVAVGAGSVWVARNDDRTLLRIDPRSNRVTAAIPTGALAFAVAAASTAVWVSDFEHDALVRVDPHTNRVVAVLGDLPHGPAGIAITPGAVWVTYGRSDVVTRVDPATNRVVATIPVAARPLAVVAAFGAIWVHSQVGATVSRIDPVTDGVLVTVPVGPSQGREGLDDMGVARGGVWVAAIDLLRIDPRTNGVSRRLSFNPNAVTASQGFLWVTSTDGSVQRVEPPG
jgi:YVTN family beta-propeller protein